MGLSLGLESRAEAAPSGTDGRRYSSAGAFRAPRLLCVPCWPSRRPRVGAVVSSPAGRMGERRGARLAASAFPSFASARPGVELVTLYPLGNPAPDVPVGHLMVIRQG